MWLPTYSEQLASTNVAADAVVFWMYLTFFVFAVMAVLIIARGDKHTGGKDDKKKK